MNNVMITGGSSGMGKSTVIKFLDNGDRVVFMDRNSEGAQALMKELDSYVSDNRLFFFQGDISNDEDLKSYVAFSMEKLQGRIDVLVNCAAIFVGGMAHECTEADFHKQFNINVLGVFLLSGYIINEMLKSGQDKGAIINIASDAGINGSYNMPLYAASKAAVISISRSLALDYGSRNIRTNCVCPSATGTPMFYINQPQETIDMYINNNPMKRIGQPEEIADLIIFLASDNAAYINGQIISVDGGLSAWCGEPRQNRDTGM